MFSKKNLFIACLCVVAVLTRFYKLDWGDEHYFHPDENNMATAISKLSFQSLNPHFYAYGQFPLYLTYFSLRLINLSAIFPNSIMALRFWSAFFSLASLVIFYKIAQNLKVNPLTFLPFLIFTPGLIQLSHFGTTESLLILVFATSLLLSLKLLKHPTPKVLTQVAIICGLGLATKITAVFFLGPVLLTLLVMALRRKSYIYFLGTVLYFIFIAAIFFVLLSPYNWLNFADFRSTMVYETSVAIGSVQVFYTRQFLHTIPYLFQFTHIFPYVNGLPILILGILGLFHLTKDIIFHKSSIINHTSWLIILIPSLFYFLYQGQLFTKWTRFMSPLFFLGPLLATYFLSKLPLKTQYLLTFIAIIPGLIFFSIYLRPDNRLVFSQWMDDNLPANATILSEAGNVVNMPFSSRPFQTTNFDFYGLDDSRDLKSQLPQQIANSQYLLIPSRRIFKNQSNSQFPTSNNYYHALFSGQLGFKPIYQLSSFFLNDENAEETWTVFDHPTIRLYQKTHPLNLFQYEAILKS